MPRSMTAFERRERTGEWGRMAWELRSVNHRYLDVNPRLPEEFRQLETAVRERVGAKLARGKVECALRFESVVAGGQVQVNWPYAEQLIDAAGTLADRLGKRAGTMSPVELMRMPGVMSEPAKDLEPLHAAALELLDETLDGFVQSREREGKRLGEMIRERAEKIAELAAVVRQDMPAIQERLRTKLETRLAELAQPADPGRLEQELVYLAQRMDVEEELDRLLTHVEEIQRVLRRKEPIGRRLDFLMQELNREANTLGSKSAALETTQVSVDMKVLIEQMREQIQNLE
ncbi:MAG: YicC family protein [Ectothiorhodospiraceae bacterium]|nr:YicC family protein [Ectothiorhodospiraceae bacterium]MCH8502863.1 YicC family protein [Ectothiorhodospiraceae bacterium]